GLLHRAGRRLTMQLGADRLVAGRTALRAGNSYRDLPFEQNYVLGARTAACGVGAGQQQGARGKLMTDPVRSRLGQRIQRGELRMAISLKSSVDLCARPFRSDDRIDASISSNKRIIRLPPSSRPGSLALRSPTPGSIASGSRSNANHIRE